MKNRYLIYFILIGIFLGFMFGSIIKANAYTIPYYNDIIPNDEYGIYTGININDSKLGYKDIYFGTNYTFNNSRGGAIWDFSTVKCGNYLISAYPLNGSSIYWNISLSIINNNNSISILDYLNFLDIDKEIIKLYLYSINSSYFIIQYLSTKVGDINKYIKYAIGNISNNRLYVGTSTIHKTTPFTCDIYKNSVVSLNDTHFVTSFKSSVFLSTWLYSTVAKINNFNSITFGTDYNTNENGEIKYLKCYDINKCILFYETSLAISKAKCLTVKGYVVTYYTSTSILKGYNFVDVDNNNNTHILFSYYSNTNLKCNFSMAIIGTTNLITIIDLYSISNVIDNTYTYCLFPKSNIILFGFSDASFDTRIYYDNISMFAYNNGIATKIVEKTFRNTTSSNSRNWYPDLLKIDNHKFIYSYDFMEFGGGGMSDYFNNYTYNIIHYCNFYEMNLTSNSSGIWINYLYEEIENEGIYYYPNLNFTSFNTIYFWNMSLKDINNIITWYNNSFKTIENDDEYIFLGGFLMIDESQFFILLLFALWIYLVELIQKEKKEKLIAIRYLQLGVMIPIIIIISANSYINSFYFGHMLSFILGILSLYILIKGYIK